MGAWFIKSDWALDSQAQDCFCYSPDGDALRKSQVMGSKMDWAYGAKAKDYPTQLANLNPNPKTNLTTD